MQIDTPGNDLTDVFFPEDATRRASSQQPAHFQPHYSINPLESGVSVERDLAIVDEDMLHQYTSDGGYDATDADGLAVIIINHNSCDYLSACLYAIRQEAPDQIIVVDNASSDGSAEMVRVTFPEVCLIQSKKNLGYGPATNLAVAHSRFKYFLLLNSDTQLCSGAVKQLKAYLDAHPQAAVVGPKVLNPDGTWQLSCFPFPGTWGWFVENDPAGAVAGWVPWLRRRLMRYTLPTRGQAVPWVLGAALAVRRPAFEALDGFDESFFMYYEEVDLCYRLSKAGWETHCCPDAATYHVGGVSTSKKRVDMLVQNYISTLHFYRKHYNGARLYTWLFLLRTRMWLRLFEDGIRFFLMPKSKSKARAVLWEKVIAWRWALAIDPNRDPAQVVSLPKQSVHIDSK